MLIPQRIEAIKSPAPADERTLRLCFGEADAIRGSVAISRLTYREIAARMGVSKSLVNAWAKGERTMPQKRVQAFCNATGSLLLKQYQEFACAMRKAEGRVRERDRIAEMIAPTLARMSA